MSDEDQGQEKTEEPTDKRREDFRKKGQVANSRELSSVGVLLAVSVCLGLWAPRMGELLGNFIVQLLGEGAADPELILADPIALLRHVLWLVFAASGPVALTAAGAGFLLSVSQVGLHFESKPMEADLKKMDPIQGLKSKLFSAQAAAEWLKSLGKVLIVMTISWEVMKRYADGLYRLPHMELGASLHWAAKVMALWIGLVLLTMGVLALGDLAFVRWNTHRKMKMTREELKRENKEQEGDPQLKAKIKRLMLEMSRNRLVAEVGSATVVVTNPTHYAIALRYEAGQAQPPVVVARGMDARAVLIKDIARSNGVPRVENRPLARALHAEAKEGQEVPYHLFEAVAEVLAFVYRLRTRQGIRTGVPGD